MPLDVTPVSQLNSDLSACKVKVRIARAWTYHKQDTPKDITGLDLLLMDDKVLGYNLYMNLLASLYHNFIFNLHLSIPFLSVQGDRIQASIRSQLVSKFQDKLEEGECYMIMNFEISDNGRSYRASSHPYKINFMSMTYVKKCEQIPNLEFRFNFVPFSDIQAQTDNDNVFIGIFSSS